MELDKKIRKLKEKQHEAIQNAKKEIAAIKAEYVRLGYKTDNIEKKEAEVIELIKDYFLIVANQMINRPDISQYENMANEMERLLSKKKEIIFKLNYPLMKQKQYKKVS